MHVYIWWLQTYETNWGRRMKSTIMGSWRAKRAETPHSSTLIGRPVSRTYVHVIRRVVYLISQIEHVGIRTQVNVMTIQVCFLCFGGTKMQDHGMWNCLGQCATAALVVMQVLMQLTEHYFSYTWACELTLRRPMYHQGYVADRPRIKKTRSFNPDSIKGGNPPQRTKAVIQTTHVFLFFFYAFA